MEDVNVQLELYNNMTKETIAVVAAKIIAAIGVFFMPILPAMIACGILISIDTITGIISANRQGKEITSKRLGRVLTKMLVYQLLIIAAHLTQTYLFKQIPLVNITLAFIGMTEFLSISENFQGATGKNLVKYIREWIDVKFRGMIK